MLFRRHLDKLPSIRVLLLLIVGRQFSWIFLFLSIIGLRQWLVRIMPQSLILAVGAGIGVFIAWVSMSFRVLCLF